MTGLLLDTHVWFWLLTGSDRLPGPLRDEVLAELDACWLSPISVWELGIHHQKGRIELSMPYEAWLDRSFERLPLREAPLNHEIVRRSLDLDLPHRDPADRFLAATTLVYDLRLATVDHRLVGAAWLPTLSGA